MKAKSLPVLVLACTGLFCRMHGAEEDPVERALYVNLLVQFVEDATGRCDLVESGSTRKIRIRSTSSTNTTYCNLQSGSQVEDRSSNAWDIGFQRYRGATNGGTSGNGQGSSCSTTATSLAAVTSLAGTGGSAAPLCPHLSVDKSLSGDSGGAGGASTVNFSGSEAFVDWYTYNIFSHALTTRSYVYIVRSGDGARLFRLQILDYYNPAGTAGYPLLLVSEVNP